MLSPDIKPSAGTNQAADRVESAGTASDSRCDSGADNAHFGKRPPAKNETRAKQDVDGVAQPQHTHRDGRIAGAAEDSVDYEEQNYRGIAGEHHSGKPAAIRNHLRRCSHPRKQLWSEWSADERDYSGDD